MPKSAGKKRRKLNRNTILWRLLIPIMAVILIQTFIFTVVFWQGGVISNADHNAYEILDERVLNRKQYIENEMIHRWSNLDESETAILQTVFQTLKKNQATISDIGRDSELNEEILSNLAPEIVYLLRKNAVTGAFVILDGPGIQSDKEGKTRAGFYIRDLDPTSYAQDNSDILVERGMPQIAKESGLTLDSYWSPALVLKGDGSVGEKFYAEPLNAAKSSDNKESANFGYWSERFTLSELDGSVFTYSIPLIAEDGTVFGVMGVEIGERYLFSLLKYDEISTDKNGAYYIGISQDGGQTYKMVSSNGPLYTRRFGEQSTLALKKREGTSVYEVEEDGEEGDTVLASVKAFKLYNTNTPFENQQWALIGLIEESKLLSFSGQITQLAYTASALSLILGLLGVFFASRMVTRPITSLVENLKKSDPNRPVTLKKLNIEEIDELTVNIENLSRAVAESSSRISKILSMTKSSIGVFEYASDIEYIFCSNNLAEILGWELDWQEGEDGAYIARDIFVKKMKELESRLYDADEHIYRLSRPDGVVRWIQISTLPEKGKLLGAVSDVTKDMVAKQKIEYERDYDLLTNLYNRRAFQEKLSELFTRNELKVAALIMWDLDNLKYINDTYGHDYGDRYIVALSECLQFFNQYGGITARRSGDEFYTLLYGFEDKQKVREIIDRGWEIIQRRSFMLPNGLDYRVRVSGGIAWYPDDAEVCEDLVRYADYAMYTIKHTVKGSMQEFDKQSYLDNAFILNGQEALGRLIDQQLVQYALQPILSVETGEIFGYEMLMRPMTSELSSPVDVLRIAQAESKLYHIERMTWFKALETFSALLEQGKVANDAHVFINSIGSQIMEASDIEKLEEQYGTLLNRVVIEIVESEPSSKGYLGQKIEIARRWHAQLAIDDYGTGYNSEASLIFMSPDLVKLDMSIVRDIDQDANRQNLLEGLIGYARKRGVKILAEGVETQGEMRTLVQYGVDYLQGYYIGMPELEVYPVDKKVIEAVLLALREANGKERK